MVFCFDNKKSGFTILELVVVLACFTIIAMMIPAAISQQFVISSDSSSSEYVNGRKVKVAIVKNDLKRATTQLSEYKTKYGHFPSTNRCDKPTDDKNICLISYQSTIFNYQYNNEKYALSGIRQDLEYLFEISSEDSTPISKFLVTVNSISVADKSSCVISTTNDIRCWGNYWGYSGDEEGVLENNLEMSKFDVSVLNAKNLQKLSISSDHSCAVLGGSKTYCWGLNSSGQLGSGLSSSDNLSYSPTQLLKNDLTDIDVHGQNSCGIDLNGLGYCWGDNTYGQIGNNSNKQMPIPTKVSLNNAKFVSVKTAIHSCGLTTDYKLYCWGRNNFGQIGDGTLNDSNIPILVSNNGELKSKKIINFDVSDNHTCALTSEAKIYCWGRNNSGQLGDGTYGDSKLPKNIATTTEMTTQSFKNIAIDDEISCGLSGKNKVYCWGDNSKLQIGASSIEKSSKAVKIYNSSYLNAVTISSISVAPDHVCVLDAKGFVYCWGNNSVGQLGDGTTISSEKPLFVMPGTL